MHSSFCFGHCCDSRSTPLPHQAASCHCPLPPIPWRPAAPLSHCSTVPVLLTCWAHYNTATVPLYSVSGERAFHKKAVSHKKSCLLTKEIFAIFLALNSRGSTFQLPRTVLSSSFSFYFISCNKDTLLLFKALPKFKAFA